MSERLRELQQALEKQTQEETAFARSIKLEVGQAMTSEERTTLENLQAAISSTQLLAEAEKRSIDLEKMKVEGEVELRTAVDTRDLKTLTEKKLLVAFARGISLNSLGLNNNELEFLKAARANTFVEQQRGMNIGTPADGGYLTFDYFSKKLIDKLRSYSGVMELCEIMYTSTGNPFYMPTVDDADDEAVAIDEATAATQDKLPIGRKTLGAYKYSTKIFKVSNELLTDSIIEIEALLLNKMRARFGKSINRLGTFGTGVAQPTGYALAGQGQAQDLAVAVSGAVSYAELNTLVGSVNRAYLQEGTAKWSMNQWTEQSLRTVNDGAGRPIWGIGDLSKGNPNTLFGFPIVINNHMSNLNVASAAISFGAHDLAHTVRIVNGTDIKRSDQVYFETDEIGFVGFKRYDAKAKQPEAIGILKGKV